MTQTYEVDVKLELNENNYYVTEDTFTLKAKSVADAREQVRAYMRAWGYEGRITEVRVI